MVMLALGFAAPIGWNSYERLIEVNRKARVRLIEQHRLWELQADYRGKPETWTRIAAYLLNDGQLLARVALKYGGQSEQVELEYRRDLAMARAEVVLAALALWALPLGLVYGLSHLVGRRRPLPPPKIPPASVSDPRYLPPDEHP